MADRLRKIPHRDLRGFRDGNKRVVLLLNFLEEDPREDRVWIGIIVGHAVKRRLPHTSGVEDENAFGRGSLRKPARAPETSGRAGFERIVTARVQDEDHGASAAVLQIRDDLFSRNSLAGEEAFLALHDRRYIGRQDVIDATDLDAVSGIIKQGKIARTDPVGKGGKLSNEIAPIEVGCELNLKAERLQRG